ncbi:Cathepsin_L [Hexamita inflata]|uniref:Cathepsin L n=1 Tax=Hexamita inflata TaxID=28002 RepID=A0AA86UAV4_9EUKA|nr:Cathepsin L [Hexamita inflata]
MLFVLATQVDLTQLSCDQAFVEFKKEYPDNRGSSQDIFCENFEIVKKLLLEDPTLEIGLVPQMDTVSPSKKLTPKNGAVSPKRQPHMLQGSINDYCPSFNPLPDLPQIPISMDLREAGLVTSVKAQGGCGSCYAFHTIAVLETAVLRDKENLNDFWKAETNKSSFALSEQFLLSNSFCNQCGYCGGGNFVIQTYLMVKGNQVQKGTQFNSTVTVELDSNYKYDYKVREANWTAKIPLEPKLAPENYLLPVKFFKNSGDCAPWCNTYSNETPTVKVADEKNRKFNAAEIYRIKSYLARGMALAIQMDTGLSQTFPYSKSSKILYTECTSFSMNHAVTLVGYGRKEGKEVWIIKNSYGAGWGQQGYFFIEIGSNSFCIEHNAYTLVPKYYNVSETTAYPRGNMVRGLAHTLDCDIFFVKNSTKADYYCYDACPENYPYNEATGQCVVRCASGFYQNFGTMKQCLPACQGLSVVNSSNADSYQCVGCTANSPYFDGTACASRCASGSYNTIPNNVQPFVCVPSCTFYVLNATNADSKTCLSSCPANIPFSDSGLCSARCTSGAYSNATGPLICQDSCLEFFFVNTTNDNSRLCLSVCPATQMTNGKECVFVCPAATPYNDSFNCVDLCASKAYSVAKSAQTLLCQNSCAGLYVTNTSNNNSKQCVTACPSTSPYNDSLSCSARCASGAYTNAANILTCQASCPDYIVTNATNQNSVQCVAQCTAAQMTNGKQCVLVCPAASSFNDSLNCVSRCASGAYSLATGKAQLLVCQASCPNFFVTNTSNQNSLQCVAACTASQLKNGKECVASCPTTIPFNDTLACAARCASGAYSIVSNQAQTLVCQASCASNFITNASNGNSKQCVSTCPTPLVVSSKECLKTCPSAAPYSDASACVAKCSSAAYSLISGQDQTLVCKKSCPQYIMNVTSTSKQCFDKCPDDVPYSAAGLCSLRCPAGAYSVISANTQQLVCQASCANYYIVNKTNADSKQCVNPCPSEYMVSGKECVLKCPDNIPYNDSKACVGNCPTKAYQLVNDQFTCLPSCKLYTMNDTNAHKICYEKCPDAVPYADNSLCVSRCPLGAYQDMVCQDSCQNFHVVNKSNHDSFQCFDVCPSSSAFVDGIECKQSCSFYKDSLTKGLFECVDSCTLYVLNGTNQHCVDACQTNQKNKGGQCVLKSSQSAVVIGVVVPIVIVAIGAVVGICFFKKKKTAKPVTYKIKKSQTQKFQQIIVI